MRQDIIYSLHTNEVEHHLRGVVRCGGDAQELLSFSHSGVVDRLHVDVVTRHHGVTDLSVLLCVCHLPNRCVMCPIHILKCLQINSDLNKTLMHSAVAVEMASFSQYSKRKLGKCTVAGLPGGSKDCPGSESLHQHHLNG